MSKPRDPELRVIIAFMTGFIATWLLCSALQTYFLNLSNPYWLMVYGGVALLLSTCIGSACGSYVEDRREWNDLKTIK